MEKSRKRLYIFRCESDDENWVMAYVCNNYKQALSMARNSEWSDWYDSLFDFWCDLRGKRRRDIDASKLEYWNVWLEKWMEIGIYTGEL